MVDYEGIFGHPVDESDNEEVNVGELGEAGELGSGGAREPGGLPASGTALPHHGAGGQALFPRYVAGGPQHSHLVGHRGHLPGGGASPDACGLQRGGPALY